MPNDARETRRHTSHRPPVIATVLTPLERIRVDVAADGVFEVVHRSSVEELTEDVRVEQVDAVIVSVARYDTGSTARMAAMVREFPTIPTFALLTDVQRSTPHSVLELGRVGVRTLIDARSPSGWSALRELLTHERSSDVQRQMLGCSQPRSGGRSAGLLEILRAAVHPQAVHRECQTDGALSQRASRHLDESIL